MSSCIGSRFHQHLVHIRVGNIYLGFVTDIVGYRPDQAKGSIPLKMSNQGTKPTRRNVGVVVEKYQVLAGGYSQSLVIRCSEPTVVIVKDQLAVLAVGNPLRQECRRSITGGIVNHNDFHMLVLAVRIQAFQAGTGKFKVVVRYNHNADFGVMYRRLGHLNQRLGAVLPGLPLGEGFALLHQRVGLWLA